MTYGLSCAPFLALRTIIQLIEDEGSKYSLAIAPLTHGRYVDDIFSGADSIHHTQQIITQLISLCKAGGFPLQKWTTNEPTIFNGLCLDYHEKPTSTLFNEANDVHILGLCWNSTTDQFHFSVSGSPPTKVTKRTVLSLIAKIFDPPGLLGPVIISSKIFMQELWSQKKSAEMTLFPSLQPRSGFNIRKI